MENTTWFADLKSNKSKVTIGFPPVTLPEGATPAVIGPILNGNPLYLHEAEGTRSYNRDELLSLKFPQHTAEQFATLVWQSDDWNERIVQLAIEAGEVAAADLDMTFNTSIRDLRFGARRGQEGFGGSFEMVDGVDLSDVETVEMFEAHNVGLTSDHLASLPNPWRLVRLELDTADVLPADLARFSNLKVLQLGGINGLDDLSYLANMPNIVSLGIRHSNFGGFDDPESPGLECLRLLDIAYNSGLGPDLSGLAGMPGLQMLDLSGTAIDGSSIATLRGMSSLTRLTMQSTKLRDTDLSSLQDLPQITNLDVAGTDITDVGLRIIVDSLPNLRYLDIRATNVTEQGTAALSQAKNLFSLGLDGTLLTVSLAERLTADTNLGQVYVCPPYINDDFFETGEPIDIIGAVKYVGRPL